MFIKKVRPAPPYRRDLGFWTERLPVVKSARHNTNPKIVNPTILVLPLFAVAPISLIFWRYYGRGK
ncbi:MAG: hypothetical protein H5T69_19485 [Chloroflexi bacterium]|nr:hypothetical protein [Chloroflexota bacterium]